MATPNAGVLDTVLNTFRSQIDSGFGALQGPVHGTLGTLIVISVVLMALFWALDESGSIFSPIIRKALVVGWWSYLILNWQTTALAVFTAFGNLGAQVGNAGGLAGFLNQPSKVVQLGLTNAQVLLDLALYYLGNSHTNWGTPPVAQAGLDVGAAIQAIMASAVLALEAVFGALLIIIGYFWLALEIVVATIEFHIVILMGFCVLPFGVFERTASYAERVLSYVISAGFKVMALGIVIGLSQTFLANYQVTYTPGALPGLDQMAGLALGVLVVLMLAISAPKYAQAVISGNASTGMGSLAGAAGLAVGAGMAVAGTAKAAFAGGQSVMSGASKAASSVGSMMGGGAKGGSSPSPGSPSGGSPGGSSPGSRSGPLGGEAPNVSDLAATIPAPGGQAAAGATAPPAPSVASHAADLAETISAANNNTAFASTSAPPRASSAAPTAPAQGGMSSSKGAGAPSKVSMSRLAASIQAAADEAEGGATSPPTSGATS